MVIVVLCVVEHFWVLVPDMILVMMSEFVVDWVKHAFITKFNEIPSEVSALLLSIVIDWVRLNVPPNTLYLLTL